MFNFKNVQKWSLLTVLVAGVASKGVFAGPRVGSVGRSHGGGNWRGAVNQALRGAQTLQNHSHGHRQPAAVQPARPVQKLVPHSHGHVQPTAPRRGFVPQRSAGSTPHLQLPQLPRINVVPRLAPHGTVAPRITVPRVNAAPQRSHAPAAAPNAVVVPQRNPQPVAAAVPRTNVVPSRVSIQATQPVVPAPNRVPSGPNQINTMGGSAAAAGQWRNEINRMSGGTTDVPESLAPAAANAVLPDFVANLTQADLDRMIAQIDQRDVDQIDQARQAVLDSIEGAIDNLPNAAQLTAADRRAIRDAIANGDADAVRNLLGEAANTAAGQELIDMAAAIDALDDVRDALNGDAFGGDTIANLLNAVQNLDLEIDLQQQLIDLVAQVAVDQQVVAWLDETDPGVGAVPFGADLPIVLVPGLPEGLLMPLAGGPVMIGAGETTDDLVLGTGNPLEVAGLPVAMSGEEPAAAAAEPVVAGQIILANPASEAVNYNLNDQPQVMQPNHEQKLPGTSSWIITFDRGGNFGTARYQLSEGYFYFKATEKGWELVRKTFNATLDNSGNTFSFNYVIDNEQKTINPGETHEFSGKFPPVLRFDNGQGEVKQRRLDSGSYKVAFGEGLKLDVYKAESVASPRPVASEAAPAPAAGSATAIPAPKPISTNLDATTAGEPATGRTLPEGFTLFDSVKALTGTTAARSLPKSFTLFRAAAGRLQASVANE
jgi:hypothetical protein